MLAFVALLQVVVAQPLPDGPAPEAFPWTPDPATLSLVVARTVEQSDPRPLCPQRNCTSLYRGTFSDTKTIAGMPLPRDFAARIEMGSPFISHYTLALIVERRPDGELLIRAQRGYDTRTHQACFDPAEIKRLGWRPSAESVVSTGNQLCVTDR